MLLLKSNPIAIPKPKAGVAIIVEENTGQHHGGPHPALHEATDCHTLKTLAFYIELYFP